MTSYGTGRRIRLEVEMPGGIVAITVTDATVEQAAAVNRLVDEWLRGPIRGETVERVVSAPTRTTSKPAVPDRVCPMCNAGPFASGHLLGAHKRTKHPTTPVGIARELRKLELAGTRAGEATADLAATVRDLPAVALCACGHPERVHVPDDDGRGPCVRGGCGCSEYRAEGTA